MVVRGATMRRMEHRLTRIATRSGDDGTTGLADGRRLSKSDRRVQALGDVDELNSSLGVLLAEPLLPDAPRELLLWVQHELFNLGAELSLPPRPKGTAPPPLTAAIEELDVALERLNAALPPLREFILPGGSRAAALAHLSRTIARRAERSVVALGERESIDPAPQRFLNRLSDLLFVLARTLNRNDPHGVGEIYWSSERLARRGAAPESGSGSGSGE